MAKLKITIKAENIGIHTRLSKVIDSTSAKLGFYASNGSGKTFLSKAFALYERAKSETPPARDIERLLAFGHDSGNFEFAVEGIDPVSPADVLKISLSRSSGVSIDSTSKYKFHVFNSDYVKRNLEEKKYSPSGEISGVIIGTTNIDVAKEETILAELQSETEALESQIDSQVQKARTELSALGIRSKTAEFAELSKENAVATNYAQSVAEKFDVLVERFRKLESMPDDLSDVANVPVPLIDDFFEELISLLTQEHSQASFAEDFKERVRNHDAFFRKGIELSKDKKCPFCQQQLGENAIELIDRYEEFLNDEEARVVERCKLLKKRLNSLKELLQVISAEWIKLKLAFENIKAYLPSSSDLELADQEDVSILNPTFAELDEILSRKESDVRFRIGEDQVRTLVSTLKDFENRMSTSARDNQPSISEVNKRKNDLSGQKLQLKRSLCLARVISLRESVENDRSRLVEIAPEVRQLRTDIRGKQSQNKREKKAEVARAFKELLEMFFGTKYSFDDEKFCLTFSDARLAANAEDVLSDGEKGIVAFCHYLAMTHVAVESDDDYKNLFFVIDDPISSMDFHFVYKVGECIRRLGTIFPLTQGRLRYLVLTHNLEFISILGRNGICAHTFSLRNGEITRTDCSSALPYEPHLQDIIRIAEGLEIPNHTTSNSIRHTLETIGKFLQPGCSFEGYFGGIETFKADPYLWSLINDQSHGAVRDQPGFVTDDIKRSCELVVQYVESKFPDQVPAIKARAAAV